MFLRGKMHWGLIERMGFISAAKLRKLQESRNIWIHAVSVGEVLAVASLAGKIKAAFPEYKIICSTVTKTGQKIASEQLRDKATIIYAPLDFSIVVNKFIKAINPVIYISAETEIWPSLYLNLKRRNIPIIVINGRISDKSYQGYKAVKFLIKNVISCVNVFCMQTTEDATRIIALGAEKDKVKTVGNVKFDTVSDISSRNKRELGFSGEDMVFLAGSTHLGEEEIVIRAFKELQKEFKRLYLIVVPRHIERAPEVFKICQQENVSVQLYSKLIPGKASAAGNIVVDVMGELRSLYGIADIVFIGKTFVKGGGQNMIEPVSLGKPTFVGPMTENFKSVMEIFLKEKIIFQVNHPSELTGEIIFAFKDGDKLKNIAARGKEIISRHQGATMKSFEIISGQLKSI